VIVARPTWIWRRDGCPAPSWRFGALTDSPHGYSTTAAKTYAARDLLRRGVQEIDTVMNTGSWCPASFNTWRRNYSRCGSCTNPTLCSK